MEKTSRFVSFFRDALWINAQRIQLYCSLFLVVFFVVICILLLTLHQGVDWNGKPFGTDFISFWSASELSLHGHAADVYVLRKHQAAQLRIFPNLEHYGYTAFFYPPVFLIICLPLALAPYFWSLFLWLSLTGYACWQAIKKLLPNKTPWVVYSSFPALYINILHGQNAFLSCALLTQGIYLFSRKSVYSGVFLGFLCFKPHLALCVPVFLVVARQWRALGLFTGTTTLLVLVSWGCFGTVTWEGFLHNISVATAALDGNAVGYGKMVSIFAAVRLLHGSLFLSYTLQICVDIIVVSVLFYIVFRKPVSLAAGMMLIITTLVVTPFLLDYDLMLLAPVLAWTVGQAQKQGFMPYERFIVACAFLLPVMARPVALFLHIPIAPLVLLSVVYSVARRSLEQPDVCSQFR